MPEILSPINSTDMNELTTPWYSAFVELDKMTLFEIIAATNYLDIKPLFELSCAKVACIIKNS